MTSTMAERRTNYDLEDLLASGRGELLGAGNAQLPLPPMLMFDCVNSISETGGAHAKGQVLASLRVAGNPALDWIFACHFSGDPVIPGSFCLDALWRLDRILSRLAWRARQGPRTRRRRGEVYGHARANHQNHRVCG